MPLVGRIAASASASVSEMFMMTVDSAAVSMFAGAEKMVSTSSGDGAELGETLRSWRASSDSRRRFRVLLLAAECL